MLMNKIFNVCLLMMIDTCLILGIMEKEKLPNLGKYSLSSYKQESKFNKFSSFSLSKMLKNTL